jgi:hypothetical protein
MDDATRTVAAALGDRYEIERELGVGGMARVYLARDLRHERLVAVKVLRPELASGLGAERFLREIQVVARLQHPHILGLVDSGERDGLLFYVMPYVAGESLRARLDRERELPIPDALAILREVADALAHAHAEGVVHRDVKPENILLSGGHAQVADFGIARMATDASGTRTITASGIFVGSPSYVAPEQAAADPKADHRVDLYAFGALAYEMLSGTPPFTAPTVPQLLALHMTAEPQPLSQRRSSVPARLDALVLRCLRKHPADRFQSAREIVAELDRLLAMGAVLDAAPREARVSSRRFPITDAMARALDRTTFDPRILGDALEYLDNDRPSDVLVVLLNAIWLDGSDFEPHLKALPYRCVAPTLHGYEPGARRRLRLTLADHFALFAGLVRHLVEESRPRFVVAAGFSISGDFLLRLVASRRPEDAIPLDGVLALGPNLGLDTCFLTRVLVELDASQPDRFMRALRSLGDVPSNIDEWLVLNGYMGRVLSKFREDVTPLRELAREFVAPFVEEDGAAFDSMFREASGRVRALRCLFEDTDTCNRLLREAHLRNRDAGVFGPAYQNGSLRVADTPSHFDLAQPERVGRHLAAMIEELARPA